MQKNYSTVYIEGVRVSVCISTQVLVVASEQYKMNSDSTETLIKDAENWVLFDKFLLKFSKGIYIRHLTNFTILHKVWSECRVYNTQKCTKFFANVL